MQNRYVGDIGDFGKYGLLRVLCNSSPPLKLGVVWYLYNPRDERTDDGKHTAYLDWEKPKPTKQNLDRFASCDGDLYRKLRKLVQNKDRNVSAVRKYGILPSTTVFYEKEFTFASCPSKEVREERRNRWLEGAERKTEGCDVIFLDPDNGLEVKSVRPYYKKGPKYVFLEEIKSYIARKQSIVIYQHLSRRGTAEDQVQRKINQLREALAVRTIVPLHYHRGTARVFFIIPSDRRQEILRRRTDKFLRCCWGKHFTQCK